MNGSRVDPFLPSGGKASFRGRQINDEAVEMGYAVDSLLDWWVMRRFSLPLPTEGVRGVVCEIA